MGRGTSPWAAAAAALIVAGCVAAVVNAATDGPAAKSARPVYLDTHYPYPVRAADLVSRMTLAEKVPQLNTNDAPAIPRLGVQQYTYWSEGLHGVNTLGANTNSGDASGAVHATSFPTNLAAAMTWDPQLIYQETTAVSDEARGFLDKSLWDTGQNNIGPSPGNYGSLTYWAPNVNLDRDPRWGRSDESFGEDPYLLGQVAGAFVNGYQGQSISGASQTGYLKVAATAKHYALNNVDNTRAQDSANTTDANIRDYYTAQFRDLAENAHVSGLMTSYNAINGTPAPANTYTANELAQRTYGFGGYMTSDCGAVADIYNSTAHNWAPPGWTTSTSGNTTTWTNTATGAQVPGAAGGQAYALRAGTDLNCIGAEATLPNIQAAIDAGILSEAVIDTDLVHLFTVRMQTGEFDPPSRVPYTKISKDVIESPAHQALARQIADNAIVLLKNDNLRRTGHPLLPVDATKLNHVVIVGNLADTVTLGGYAGDPSLQVSAVQGIVDAVRAANPSAVVTFDACGTSTKSATAASCSAATTAAMKTADLVIAFVGTDMSIASEGLDRANIAMPGNYSSLLSQVTASGNPNTALVIQSSGPIDISSVQSSFPAIVFSGYNGESQGSALADVFTGAQNPSGHLDFTWFKNDSQLPAMDNYGLAPSETGGLGRTYMYFTGTPTYPFGYGLSYSQFDYRNVQVSPKKTTPDGDVTIKFTVTNTGPTAGATVAQLYAAPQFSVPSVELPNKRLVGFQKTRVLAPGRSQHISLTVPTNSLSRWDQNSLKQVVDTGSYRFQVATDADHVVGSGTAQIAGTITPRVQHVTVQPAQITFKPGDKLDLAGKNPWIADDTNPALEEPHADADDIIEAVNNDQSFVDLKTAKVKYASSNRSVATVSSTGSVTAIAHGAAQIRVTVNGVTGTMPVVVKQPFSLSAPSVVEPGGTITARTTLPNASSKPLTSVSMALAAPAGWTVSASTPTTFRRVAPGDTATTTWKITVPSTAKSDRIELNGTATFKDAGGKTSVTGSSKVSIPYDSLAAAFDNPGISDDADPAAGNLEGSGTSYSAQALAAASPAVTPGAAIAHGGLTFTWPATAPGTAGNVVASGQTIAVSGSGAKLGFLGSGNFGAATGTGTITYTDGSTQSFTLGFADWWSNAAVAGGDILTSTAYHSGPGGRLNQPVSVYYYAVPLQPGKTVRYVTLPDISPGTKLGATTMHIFAVAVG